MNTKKITKATFKSFIKKNSENLFVKPKSSFSGMTDCVETIDSDFIKQDAAKINFEDEHKLGLTGTWLVGQSRDYFTSYEDDKFTGIYASNSCGSFIVATTK